MGSIVKELETERSTQQETVTLIEMLYLKICEICEYLRDTFDDDVVLARVEEIENLDIEQLYSGDVREEFIQNYVASKRVELENILNEKTSKFKKKISESKNELIETTNLIPDIKIDTLEEVREVQDQIEDMNFEADKIHRKIAKERRRLQREKNENDQLKRDLEALESKIKSAKKKRKRAKSKYHKISSSVSHSVKRNKKKLIF